MYFFSSIYGPAWFRSFLICFLAVSGLSLGRKRGIPCLNRLGREIKGYPLVSSFCAALFSCAVSFLIINAFVFLSMNAFSLLCETVC
jgi:hypothetical protein